MRTNPLVEWLRGRRRQLRVCAAVAIAVALVLTLVTALAGGTALITASGLLWTAGGGAAAVWAITWSSASRPQDPRPSQAQALVTQGKLLRDSLLELHNEVSSLLGVVRGTLPTDWEREERARYFTVRVSEIRSLLL